MSMEHSKKGPMPEGRARCLHGHTGGGHTRTCRPTGDTERERKGELLH